MTKERLKKQKHEHFNLKSMRESDCGLTGIRASLLLQDSLAALFFPFSLFHVGHKPATSTAVGGALTPLLSRTRGAGHVARAGAAVRHLLRAWAFGPWAVRPRRRRARHCL